MADVMLRTAALVAALLTAPPPTTPALVEMPPLAELTTAAVATAPAQRLDPPAPPPPLEDTTPPAPAGDSTSSAGRCIGWERLLEEYSPGWNVQRMSRIAHRESRCQPAARNTGSTATGLLQILASHCPWLADQLHTWCSRARLTDPTFNVAAAAALWTEQGYGAWSTS